MPFLVFFWPFLAKKQGFLNLSKNKLTKSNDSYIMKQCVEEKKP